MVNYDIDIPKGCAHHAVHLEDTPVADLLDALEDTLEFIEKAIDEHGGKVLVHCHNGMSRSAAVVLAHMCYSMGLSIDEALDVLRMDCPSVAPNEGFLQQLRLFVDMGCASKPEQGLDSPNPLMGAASTTTIAAHQCWCNSLAPINQH